MISPRIFASSFIPGSIGRSEADNRSSRYANGIKGPALSSAATFQPRREFRPRPLPTRDDLSSPRRHADRPLLPFLIRIQNFPLRFRAPSIDPSTRPLNSSNAVRSIVWLVLARNRGRVSGAETRANRGACHIEDDSKSAPAWV